MENKYIVPDYDTDFGSIDVQFSIGCKIPNLIYSLILCISEYIFTKNRQPRGE